MCKYNHFLVTCVYYPTKKNLSSDAEAHIYSFTWSGKRWTRTTEPEGADLQSAAIATMRSSRKEVWDCKGNTSC